MKRRPRVQAKPVIPPKEGVSKPVTDVAADSEFASSAYRSLAVSASALVSSSIDEVDGHVFTEERDVVEVAVTTDAINSMVSTQDADGSAVESVRFHGNVAQEKNKEDRVLGNVIKPVRQSSEYVTSTDQNLSVPNLNEVSGCQTDTVSVTNTATSQVPQSFTVPDMGMSAECNFNDQHFDAVKEASLPSEESDYKQLIEDSKDSVEAGLESSGPPLKRRRFIRKQPNVVKNIQSCASVSVSTSASSIESPAEVEAAAVPQPMVELSSFAALRGVNSEDCSVATDAADNCKAPPEPTKSVDGPEISHDMDTVDLCKSPLPVPMSPPILSSKVRHHFTKVRPNLANCLTSKHSTSSDRLPKVNASTADDGPFIPPSIAAAHSAMRGLEQGIANEESVVVLPETVEKAAAKLIARKLKQKKKKRALENLDAPIDSSKVCMRDLIYMNPVNNPMRSRSGESVGSDSVKSSAATKRPIMTSTPVGSPPRVIEKVAAPQLKIGPDGSIIINEASLVIERQPVPRFEDTEAIDETDVRCGYPKRSRTRSWNKKETRRFFAALSMIGTDFFLMMNLFPGRTRAELKRKFKREEKVHQAMVETALSDRRSLDMSLMAVHSSDEEEVKPKVRQPGRRGPRANKKQPSNDGVDKSKVLGGKENDPQPILPAIKEKKQKLVKEKKEKLEKVKKQKLEKEKQQKLDEKQPGKKKKKKSRYYEESSDEAEQETEEQFESGDAESTAEEEEDDQRSVAKVPSQHMSDEDDVEIVSCFSRRPTRSGRVPKPVKTFNAVNFSDLDDSAFDSVPVTRNQPPAKRKPESFKLQTTTTPSPARSAGLMSPPPAPFMSPNRVPCSSPHGLRSPLSFYGASSPYGSPGHAPMLSPLVSCSPSSQMSLLASSIPGLENVPPGKQLMIVASPVMAGDTGEPPQQLLHVFMVSSPAPSDTCNDGQDPMPMESSTPNGNYLSGAAADSGLVAHSSNSRTTQEHCTSDGGAGILSAASQFENSHSSVVFSENVCTVANQKHLNPSQVSTSDSRTFSPTMFKTPIPNHSKSESFGTDTSRVSLLGSKFDETLASTLFHGMRQHDSANLDRTHGTNGSVSPILSSSALEYCISQVTNVAPASLQTAADDDDDSIDEDDIELEGNITDVLQQDDGTLVIIAESANVISSNGVPEMQSTDVGSDVISTESAEDRLEKDSAGKEGGTKQAPLDRGVEEKDPEAVDVKFGNGIDENGNEDMDEFIEVFIETIPDLDSTLLDSATLLCTDTARNSDIMSCATDVDNCKIATAEEKLSDEVECEKELMPAEKCVSRQYAESVVGKCISDNLESVDGNVESVSGNVESVNDISVSSKPSRYLECGASGLPSVADESTPVSISLEPVNSAAKATTDTDVSSGPLQNNNNNDTNRNRFLNVVPLPDGSVEIVLESGAWSSADPDQERYLDLEFPFVDEQAWIGCDILEF